MSTPRRANLPTTLGALLRPLRAAARTAVFFVEVLPMVPTGPVDRLTRRPIVRRVTYPTATGHADGDLYLPAGPGPHPGLVVCLGVVPFGVDHPQVARLGDALARAGFAALLYWSPAMRDRRLDPVDADSLALAYQWLIEQPAVDPARSGFLGTCVGGAFALIAAARPQVRDRVAFVAAFAPYASVWTFARDVAARTRTRDHGPERWDVDPLTRDVFLRTLTAALAPAEAAQLLALADAPDPPDQQPPDLDLSPEGHAVHRVLVASTPAEADAALQSLPAPMQDRLTAMSPLTTIDDIRAPLIALGHDRDDGVIPVSESRRLRDHLAARPGARYTEFHLFQHATPKRLPILPLVRELLRFYRYTYPLFRAAL
jgi:dienelactone hydrolase